MDVRSADRDGAARLGRRKRTQTLQGQDMENPLTPITTCELTSGCIRSQRDAQTHETLPDHRAGHGAHRGTEQACGTEQPAAPCAWQACNVTQMAPGRTLLGIA
ncbi:hypothetical protein GCM10008949_32480 [Deinococcus humi]|nr:hypothetical protein GCM10008949_32480 [Deinococcus humi]